MTNLAQTIPSDHITHGVGEPVFPELYERLRNHPRLLELAKAREAYGIAKYGQTLMTGDDRDTATEIINEMLDAMAYLMKMYMQTGRADFALTRQIALCNELLMYLDAAQ